MLAPTLKASDLDIFATVASEPNGQYSVLAAIKVKEGAKLGKTVEGLIGQALHDVPEASKNQIKLKFDTVNGVAIHRFELPADKIQGKTPSELFGAPFLYVVFRGDAVVVGVGKEGLAMVKAAMIAKEGKMPMMVYDFQLARFADLLPAPFPDHARKIFQQEGDCRFRLTIEGGKELRLRVESQPAALQFLLLMNQRKGGLGN